MVKKIKKWFKKRIGNTRLYNKYRFRKIYEENAFHPDGEGDSRSGPGSDMEQTAEVRRLLPEVFSKFNIKTMLDVPCGDFHWMSHVNFDHLDAYTGGDIVPAMITVNNQRFGSDKISFRELDVISSKLDTYDLILVRDLFVHLKFKQIQKALKNIKASGSSYLLVTSFTESARNIDLQEVGEWRPLDMTTGPFNFPEPVYMIDEKCTEGNGKYSDKALLLFKISEL